MRIFKEITYEYNGSPSYVLKDTDGITRQAKNLYIRFDHLVNILETENARCLDDKEDFYALLTALAQMAHLG